MRQVSLHPSYPVYHTYIRGSKERSFWRSRDGCILRVPPARPRLESSVKHSDLVACTHADLRLSLQKSPPSSETAVAKELGDRIRANDKDKDQDRHDRVTTARVSAIPARAIVVILDSSEPPPKEQACHPLLPSTATATSTHTRHKYYIELHTSPTTTTQQHHNHNYTHRRVNTSPRRCPRTRTKCGCSPQSTPTSLREIPPSQFLSALLVSYCRCYCYSSC